MALARARGEGACRARARHALLHSISFARPSVRRSVRPMVQTRNQRYGHLAPGARRADFEEKKAGRGRDRPTSHVRTVKAGTNASLQTCDDGHDREFRRIVAWDACRLSSACVVFGWELVGKGNGYRIENNVGRNAIEEFFKTSQVDKAGDQARNNVFKGNKCLSKVRGNRACVRKPGGGSRGNKFY